MDGTHAESDAGCEGEAEQPDRTDRGMLHSVQLLTGR